jgi:hypothetical protein
METLCTAAKQQVAHLDVYECMTAGYENDSRQRSDDTASF